MARREEGEYSTYSTDEQRRQRAKDQARWEQYGAVEALKSAGGVAAVDRAVEIGNPQGARGLRLAGGVIDTARELATARTKGAKGACGGCASVGWGRRTRAGRRDRRRIAGKRAGPGATVVDAGSA